MMSGAASRELPDGASRFRRFAFGEKRQRQLEPVCCRQDIRQKELPRRNRYPPQLAGAPDVAVRASDGSRYHALTQAQLIDEPHRPIIRRETVGALLDEKSGILLGPEHAACPFRR